MKGEMLLESGYSLIFKGLNESETSSLQSIYENDKITLHIPQRRKNQMNEETLTALAETVRLQTVTINEFLEICTILKDRIEVLEEKAKR